MLSARVAAGGKWEPHSLLVRPDQMNWKVIKNSRSQYNQRWSFKMQGMEEFKKKILQKLGEVVRAAIEWKGSGNATLTKRDFKQCKNQKVRYYF